MKRKNKSKKKEKREENKEITQTAVTNMTKNRMLENKII